jgi:hypothetical protein
MSNALHRPNNCPTFAANYPVLVFCESDALSCVEQRLEKARIKACGLEGGAFGQYRHRVVAVEAFLMASNHAEVTDPRVALKSFSKQACRVFNKDRIGGVQFGKGLFVFTFDHDLGFCWHSKAAKPDDVFKPKRVSGWINHH